MSNIQHSSQSDEWYTPGWIIDMVHEVIPNIDLDPASCEFANQKIKARRYLTKTDDALTARWTTVPVSIYLNSPGSKYKNKSKSALFWQRLIDYRNLGLVQEAIVMGFSLEQLAVTQSCTQSMGDFPICIPRKRIKFESKEGDFSSPTHSNVIVYVPGLENNTSRFKEVFSEIGILMHPG